MRKALAGGPSSGRLLSVLRFLKKWSVLLFLYFLGLLFVTQSGFGSLLGQIALGFFINKAGIRKACTPKMLEDEMHGR